MHFGKRYTWCHISTTEFFLGQVGIFYVEKFKTLHYTLMPCCKCASRRTEQSAKLSCSQGKRQRVNGTCDHEKVHVCLA